jgi:hypothetical protein
MATKLRGKDLLLHDLENTDLIDEQKESVKKDILSGRYSDFGSSSATPALDLMSMLKELGFDDLYKKAMRGNYDHDY